jgi:aspartate aminotransferase-like enzyme
MLLFTPGPTPVPETVRGAMATPTIHHRTPEFEEIFAKTRELLFQMIGMDEVILLASSGTGAMESAVINLTKSKILTINAGKFGERFGKIARSHGIENIELTYEWNTPADIKQIVDTVKNDSYIDAIAIQIGESSGGLRHPVEEIAQRVKEIDSSISIIADGITAMGVEKIDTTNIDALIGGSQKAFMLPPGLAILGLSEGAIEKIGNGKGFYFNLASEIKKQRQNTTAYTATTTLIIGLLEILNQFSNIGFSNLYKTTAKRGEAVRSAIREMGLDIYPKVPSDAMTTVFCDKAPQIRKMMKKDFQVHLAGGQEQLKNSIFRINNMGIIEPYEISWVINSLELTLDKLGIRKFTGSPNRVFVEKMFF